MANELHAHATSGLTLYAVLLNSVGQVWNGGAFEAYSGANWTSYDIALTEAGAGIYLATMPTVALGAYTYAVYERAGASPATTDTLRGTGSILWDGDSEILPVATDASGYISGISGTKNTLDALNDAADAPSAADIKTALEADGSKLDHLWEMTEDDGGVRRLTANALEEAPVDGAPPTVGDIAAAILVTPANKLETDASGRVTLADTVEAMVLP